MIDRPSTRGVPVGWHETHRYYAALGAVVAELDDGVDTLPWREEYAEIFGDRAGLLLALRRRWRLLVEAQVERPLDYGHRPSAELRELAMRHRKMLAAIDDLDGTAGLTPGEKALCVLPGGAA
ncbi:hypothetical protein FPZ12_030840 [Amycolatopsis acidicola]|uniref:Uncharacterized protein n=1 Tax=Amycolatopsis acidicola TaxID=2596893 RepID=A0A5N0UT25_9PSEU|nr:hypothetical protein [Amycolatopsis acidicola]KAA9154928.1 hypothetical protein FPZ12_030840 [Amycolatopsis acidicola]